MPLKSRLVLALGAGLLAACTAGGGYAGTHFRCDLEPSCPTGYQCVAGFCEVAGTGGTVDAGGAVDGAADAGNVVPGPDGGPTSTLILGAIADAYVDSASPATNFGGTANLRVDGSPIVRSYLSFDLSSVNGTVVKASLQLHANSSQVGGYDVDAVADTSWSEGAITYDLAPALGSVLGSSGPVTAGQPIRVDLAGFAAGPGLVSLGLTTTDPQNLSLGSRESATPPTLVLLVTP